MRAVYIVFASAFVALGIYAIPNLMELTLLNSRLSPWVSCVVVGDTLGCAILYLLGFRRVALGIYLATTAFEGSLMFTHWVPPQRLVWLTNLVPAVSVGMVLMKAGLRTLVRDEQG